MLEFLQLPLPHAQLALGAGEGVGVGQSQNDLLAEAGGQDADADVVLRPVDDHGDAAVLWLAPLGDVHAAHDLDAGDDGGQQADVIEHLLHQHAVNAVADPHLLFQRVQMNVTGSLTDGLLDDGAHQLHDGGVVQLHLLLGVQLGGLQLLLLLLLGVLLRGAHGLVIAEVLVQHGVDLRRGGDAGVDHVVGDDGDVVLGVHVQRVAHGQDQRVGAALVQRHRQHAVAAEHRAADQPDDLRVDLDPPQVDAGNVQLHAQHVDDVLLGGKAQLGQTVAQPLAALFLQLQRLAQLVVRDDVTLHQQRAQLHLSPLRHACLPCSALLRAEKKFQNRDPDAKSHQTEHDVTKSPLWVQYNILTYKKQQEK